MNIRGYLERKHRLDTLAKVDYTILQEELLISEKKAKALAPKNMDFWDACTIIQAELEGITLPNEDE